MDIKKAARTKGEKFGARKYAEVKSESGNTVYRVVKVRVRGSRNYKYICTCPDHVYRQRACKHIRSFKEREV